MVALLTTSTLYAATANAKSSTAAPVANTSLIPITFSNAAGSFVGVFDVNRFAVQGGQLVAIGTLTGTVTDALGVVVGTINQALTLPVLIGQSSGTCQILHLELGPLDLNLLGLMVHLDQVVLDITAQSGPGNLLGNLLCAIAGLLDGGGAGGSLNVLARLLNQLLTLIG